MNEAIYRARRARCRREPASGTGPEGAAGWLVSSIPPRGRGEAIPLPRASQIAAPAASVPKLPRSRPNLPQSCSRTRSPHVASVCSLGCAPHKEGVLEITAAEPFCLASWGLALLFPRVGGCKPSTKHGAALASLPPAEHCPVWDAEPGTGLLLRHNSHSTNQGK